MGNLSLLLKQSLRLCLAAALIALTPWSAAAWGTKAHRIIAGLAWNNLREDTKAKVAELLGKGDQNTLMEVATWSDELLPAQRRWHFVDIPLSAPTYSQYRDCAKKDCLVEKIEEFKRELQFGQNRQKRVEALKHLVHLLGDLHQPLHCTDNNDAGGNRVQVIFFGRITNLHKLWDSDMIERTGLDDLGYIRKLGNVEAERGQWIANWADDSHEIARKYVYKINEKQLSNAYYKTNLPILESQLAKAAVRLAQVLDDALEAGPAQKRPKRRG